MSKYLSNGAIFSLGLSDSTLVEIAQVTRIAPSGMQVGLEDVTSNASEDGWVEVAPTRFSMGSIDLEIWYDPSNSTHASITGALTSKTKITARISFPTSPAKLWTFKGYVMQFTPALQSGDAISATIKIMVSGKPTFS